MFSVGARIGVSVSTKVEIPIPKKSAAKSTQWD